MSNAVMVAVISLACLVVLFHSCNGLVCYMCYSKNYSNLKCEQPTNDTILDYGGRADYCMKVNFYKEAVPNEREETLLVRRGLMKKDYPKFYTTVAEHRHLGYQVNYSKCEEDLCNGY